MIFHMNQTGKFVECKELISPAHFFLTKIDWKHAFFCAFSTILDHPSAQKTAMEIENPLDNTGHSGSWIFKYLQVEYLNIYKLNI